MSGMVGTGGIMASIHNYYHGKHKWVEGLGEIVTAHGKRDTIAFRTAMMPGLSITYEGCGFWSLTHDESGMKLSGEYQRIDDAIRTAEELASRIDWRKIVIEDIPDQKIPDEMFDLLFEIECTAMEIQDRIDAAMDDGGGENKP